MDSMWMCLCGALAPPAALAKRTSMGSGRHKWSENTLDTTSLGFRVDFKEQNLNITFSVCSRCGCLGNISSLAKELFGVARSCYLIGVGFLRAKKQVSTFWNLWSLCSKLEFQKVPAGSRKFRRPGFGGFQAALSQIHALVCRPDPSEWVLNISVGSG